MVGHHGKTAIVEVTLPLHSPIALYKVCRGTADV